MKHYEPVWIGFITEPDLVFHSVYTIYRQRINPELTFGGEKYKCVNNEWGCYVKEAEYNKLFELKID